MRTSRPIAVLLALAAGGCGGGRGAASAPVWWVGEVGAPRVLAVSADGSVSVAAAAPVLLAPVRALASRADGSVVVLEEVSGGAPPGVLVSPGGARVAALAATDAGGAPLFDAGTPPWAAAEARDGRIWVTGRPAPVLYGQDGSYAATAIAAPAATLGVTALPDGRVLVTFAGGGAAVYAADGASAEPLTVSIGPASGPTYSGVDAVAVRPSGGLVLAALRHGVTAEGVLVDVALGPGVLAATGDPEASARLPALPSAIAAGDEAVVAGPALGPLAAPGCAEALSPDLRDRRGCLVPGAHRGVVRRSP